MAAIVQSGDSIGAGNGGNGYVAIEHLGFASSVAIHNVSVPGRTLSDAYAARVADLFPFYASQYPCILLIEIGSNDLGGGIAGDDLYNRLAAPFVRSSTAAGFYVALNTILPRADVGWSAAKEAQRLLYNRLVRANVAGADAINDVAADAVIGDAVDPGGSNYYVDGLHPSMIGQQRLAQIDAITLAPFITRSPRFV